MRFCLFLFKHKLDNKDNGKNGCQRVDFLYSADKKERKYIADNAPGNAVGNAVRQRNTDNCYKHGD